MATAVVTTSPESRCFRRTTTPGRACRKVTVLYDSAGGTGVFVCETTEEIPHRRKVSAVVRRTRRREVTYTDETRVLTES